ncbi:transcriptional regulator [Pedobacter sp. BAL39]|uniref:TetR/AcrR family transcriptional regulator n=1 Tax=Pedobacter sp. BAL39 TaxID=391596 RepID=UPI000155976F|nr:TetR/AcrR family transcriptional regulator [Pedobacter sp. BAL39]EDM35706.1 transcriptional regulator [Pedobacter sp. BAL39]
MVETDKKRDIIIEGAIKRFTHYGISKTTMNEIAEDLSVSKPSLYYYFPDKTSLIHGVLEKIFSDYFEQVEREKLHKFRVEERLLSFVEIRHRFFVKYYMLHLSGGSPDAALHSEQLIGTFMAMKEKNQKFHAEVMAEAVEKGEIGDIDVEDMAELYLDSLAGITSLCLLQGNKQLLPSKKDLKMIREKQLSLSNIFIKGLK